MHGARPSRIARVATFFWLLALPAQAQAPSYDTFSDKDGNITTEQHGRGLIALLQKPGQLEAVYADATRGDERAKRVFQILETDYFPDYGREIAELVSRPPCLVPTLRELSGWCLPDWAFLDFLRRDRPGGARLRKAFFDGYAERIHQRGLENRLVMSAMNALLGVGIATTAMAEAKTAASVPTVTEVPLTRTPSAAAARAPKLLDTARGNLLAGARSPELRNLIEQMYRRNAQVGSGSTADAIRYELRTGELLSPKGHTLKGMEMRTALTRLLKSGSLSKGDAQIARGILDDLQKALSGQ